MPESDQFWQSNPEATKSRFLEKKSDYKKLCREVKHTLKKKLENSGIGISTISSRAKKWKSFWEKIKRKGYKNPFEEVTDFAGARVVHLYAQDADKIKKIIEEEFEILNIVDKIDQNGKNVFGYSAIHFIVKLRKTTSGPRYDELKDLCCEIQVRTVLQDAWAIIEHYLGYKKNIPSALQRKLNRLAGLLEVADDQFEQVRKSQEAIIQAIENSKEDRAHFLSNELNKDTLNEYLKWKYSNMEFHASNAELFLGMLNRIRYSKLSELDDSIEKAKPLIKKIEAEIGLGDEHFLKDSAARAIISLLLVNSEIEPVSFSQNLNHLISKHKLYT
jgi:ppGpp synthetase/RelA/SpoT-type nucleotidyltranferase